MCTTRVTTHIYDRNGNEKTGGDEWNMEAEMCSTRSRSSSLFSVDFSTNVPLVWLYFYHLIRPSFHCIDFYCQNHIICFTSRASNISFREEAESNRYSYFCSSNYSTLLQDLVIEHDLNWRPYFSVNDSIFVCMRIRCASSPHSPYIRTACSSLL